MKFTSYNKSTGRLSILNIDACVVNVTVHCRCSLIVSINMNKLKHQ